MSKNRLEAFSDAVIAIVMTIMVLDVHVPEGTELRALLPVMPQILTYALSFVYLGLYWNNHHHMFQTVKEVDGSVLLANMHLLFWLSLIPFATGWLGENPLGSGPASFYGVALILPAFAYWILAGRLVRLHGADSALARAMGSGVKEKVSLGLYAAAIVLAFLLPALSLAIYILVAVVWFIPDRRMERVVREPRQDDH